MNYYVGHKLDLKRDLVCDASMVPLGEMPAEPAHVHREKAFYVEFDGGFIGAFASAAGPMLFVNADQYAFVDPTWAVRVEKKGDARRAVFDGLRGGPLVVDYPAFKASPADAWADETLDDFYQWLAAKRASPGLIRMWTLRAS